MGSSASKPLPDANNSLHEIDSLVAELSELAQTSVEPKLFYTQLLQRVVFALSAKKAAVWKIGSRGNLETIHQEGWTHAPSRHSKNLHAQERDRLLPVVENAQGEILPKPAQGKLNTWVVVEPITIQHQKHSLLAVYIEEELPLAVRQGFQRFVCALAKIASDFEHRHFMTTWQGESAAWKNYAELSLAVHGSWSLQEVAYEIANEGRRYINCDRVAVVLQRGRRSRLRAISGVDALHHHANVVRKLERLVQVALPLQQPLFFENPTEDLPPQIEKRLQEYLDEGATRSLAIVPLFHAVEESSQKRQAPFGAIVFEHFEEISLSNSTERMHLLCEQAELGLSRAVRIRSVPLLGFLMQHVRIFSWLRVQSWPRWITVLGVLSTIVACLVFLQTDFNILAKGKLEPVQKQHVFATQDGTVTSIFVKNSQLVAKGELLVKLASTSLDLEFQRISGEMLVARKELSSIRAEQLQSSNYDSSGLIKLQELSAQELALQEQLSNLTLQLEILSKKQKELQVKSPLGGRILQWDIAETLLARPVRRGDILMTVADTEGEWIARLLVPDTDIGHLLLAADRSDEDLKVSFVLAADPGTTHQGAVKHFSEVSQADDRMKTNAVLVEVEFDPKSISQLRSGASVVCKINCGKRPLGYVWLRELWEEWERRFF